MNSPNSLVPITSLTLDDLTLIHSSLSTQVLDLHRFQTTISTIPTPLNPVSEHMQERINILNKDIRNTQEVLYKIGTVIESRKRTMVALQELEV